MISEKIRSVLNIGLFTCKKTQPFNKGWRFYVCAFNTLTIFYSSRLADWNLNLWLLIVTTIQLEHVGITVFYFTFFIPRSIGGSRWHPPPPIFARKMFLTLTKRKLNSKEVGTTFFFGGGGGHTRRKYIVAAILTEEKKFFFRMCLLDQCKFIIPKHYSCQQLYI